MKVSVIFCKSSRFCSSLVSTTPLMTLTVMMGTEAVPFLGPELVVLRGTVAHDPALAGDHLAVLPSKDMSDVDIELLARILHPGPLIDGDVAGVLVVRHHRD